MDTSKFIPYVPGSALEKQLTTALQSFPSLFDVLKAALLKAPSSARVTKKHVYRLIFESFTRFLLDHTTDEQIQQINGPTIQVYNDWASQNGIQPVVEDVPGSDKKVVWIGNKNAERVVVYAHGGGYVIPMADWMLSFWLQVQRQFGEQTGGKEIAIAAIDYSVAPKGFPTQLTELTFALTHILDSMHASASKIYLAGDSAGGNLILQFLSHTLHPLPLEGVPPSPLGTTPDSEPLGGVLLISPWTSLNESTPSQTHNDETDWVSQDVLARWGKNYLSGLDEKYLSYVKPLKYADDKWFDGVDKIAKRILVTTGDAEKLMDDAVGIHDRLSREGVEGRPEVKLFIQAEGVHDDALVEFGAGGTSLTHGGMVMVEWLKAGCP
ncbi:hypothetical protein V5O48_017573 [Marasmius crinis-equi]|uniref:Alpha/beta hydrolase fold-3 domain-containing protein n=1 Tax=Marasmius crinis-equi TaxID=585013 RepID=A0ABR3ENT0_9AGAR